MNLKKLIKETEIKKIIGEINDIEINKLSINSKKTGENILFIAQKGLNSDGHDYVKEAIKNGAVAIVAERELKNISVPQIIVKNTRMSVASLAGTFYNNPKDKLKFVGITGTNGKTSSTFFLAEFLKQAGKKTAVIGTLGVFFEDKQFDSELTTPDPIKFHKILNYLAQYGAEYVVMEVSAHALDLDKLHNIKFEVGILTNITQDHLDYFKTMDKYAQTKLNWLISENVKYSIVNADDKLCLPLLINSNTLSFGIQNPADIFAVDINKSAQKTEFVLDLLYNVLICKTNLVGEFNIYNTICSAAGAFCLGVDLKDISNGMQNLRAPLGRFSVVELGNNKTAIVDYAHTPDGLKNVLATAKDICKGRLISVFGCGGNRDNSKRSKMGEISENFSDFSILTSDNPRFEKPESIINEIEAGMKKNYIKITDRKSAIEKALSMMKENDIVVISGKGAETYQDIQGVKIPYSDFEEIEKFKKLNGFEKN